MWRRCKALPPLFAEGGSAILSVTDKCRGPGGDRDSRLPLRLAVELKKH
jgi:hypothetical protein